MRRRIFEVIEVAEDKDILSKVYDVFMMIVIIISLIPIASKRSDGAFGFIELFTTIIFIIDYVLRLVTSDHKLKKGGRSFLIYPFTPIAIIDLLSILPTFNFIKDVFKLTRLVRLLKIIRVVKVVRYFEPLRIVMAVIKKQRVVLATVLALALFYVFITALIMFNAEQQIDPADGEYLFDTFFDAFYWASCTLTTVGYGDIYPISTIGRVISIISSIVGIAIIALPSGIITAGYMDEAKERRKKRKQRRQDDDGE